MNLPHWTSKLAAAAVIPVVIGVGSAFSAPSPSLDGASFIVDDSYRPGEFGVDYAAVTGPTGSADIDNGTCDEATWPNIPAKCLDDKGSGTASPVRTAD